VQLPNVPAFVQHAVTAKPPAEIEPALARQQADAQVSHRDLQPREAVE
jgi:hypothetical protein